MDEKLATKKQEETRNVCHGLHRFTQINSAIDKNFSLIR